MIRHDMSTCILCTRCVRACDEIQEVGVLDVADRGAGTRIIVGGDGDPDHAGCTWCGECVRVCPTGAIFEAIPRERFGAEALRHPDRVVRSVCPYCGVGCQVDLQVKDDQVMRVTSPWIEERTPNQGSTCVKGRFGTDFTQHRDRLTTPLIRRGWEQAADGRWRWTGEEPRYRTGPWATIAEAGGRMKPKPPRRQVGKPPLTGLPLLEDGDVRDRVATPDSWYDVFREATWEEAMSLSAQELLRIRDEQGPRALAAFSSAKCSNEENYLFMRMVRGAFRTNSVDHCTRLCHSTSVAAMNRALATAAASGSMREIEEACDVIFIAGANTTESHPVFGALIKRAVAKGARLIVADVRRTELAALADVHLQMLPGSDVALFNGMLAHIIEAGLVDRGFIASRTTDFEQVADGGQALHPRRWPRRSPGSRPRRSGRRRSSTPGARTPRPSGRWGSPSTTPAPTLSPRC
jgi:formate dehydrogenase major subunit